MSITDLSDLSPEANGRIARALNDAGASLKGTSNPAENQTSAMLHYFDAMAWEYMITRAVPDFEALADAVCEKAMATFNGSADVLGNRKRHWITEARERAANGITGERIPIRLSPMQAFFFQDIRPRFLFLQGQTGLSAVFVEGGRKDIGGPEHPGARDHLHANFATLARRAMAALGFKFSDPARAVNYWLELLRQESPYFKESRISC
jgi:hypothetical protein